jgi:hypothetical protein
MSSRGQEKGVRRWPPILAAAVLVLGACGTDSEGAGAPSAVFVLDEAAFGSSLPPPPATRALDVVAADMELDGDADLLVNWHNTGRLELFENDGTCFRLANPAEADRSGLFENRDIGELYADTDAMVARLQSTRTPGVYLWHGTNERDAWDVDTRDGWNVYAIPGDEPVRLEITTNCALVLDLDERHVKRRGESTAEIELAAPAHFRTRLGYISTQLKVRASAPLFVGAGLHAIEGDAVDLWKDDPHGIAWVDVRGTPRPDVYVTRGGMRGALQPLHDPKVDRFSVHAGEPWLYADERDAIPAGYGRGRRVEWVDIDGDLVAELYVGNTDTPNVLLAAGPDGGYSDIAPELGLDVRQGDTFAWLDVDGNGLDDLVFVGERGFEIAYNHGARRFDLGSGSEVGLVFPAGSATELPEHLDLMTLHVLDQDGDGRLDLWLSGHGAAPPEAPAPAKSAPCAGAHALYRARGAGFEDVTAEVGLRELPVNGLVVLDFDNDGFLDALSTGPRTLLLHNVAGARFEPMEVAGAAAVPAHARAIALDADGDGRLDVALFGGGRRLARNRTANAGAALLVRLVSGRGDPVGTLVTAVYAGGKKQAQRFGSATTTRYSQGVLPLHFGVPSGSAIERLEVRWPDGRAETRAVLPGETTIVLER